MISESELVCTNWSMSQIGAGKRARRGCPDSGNTPTGLRQGEDPANSRFQQIIDDSGGVDRRANCGDLAVVDARQLWRSELADYVRRGAMV